MMSDSSLRARNAADRPAVNELLVRTIEQSVMGVAIATVNPTDSPICYVNPAFLALTGYDAADVLGRNWNLLCGPKTDPAEVERLRIHQAAGEPITGEMLSYRKDGSTFWNSLAISPLRDADGRLTHLVAIMSDVTDRRTAQAKLQQIEKVEAVGLLAARIAHDFNNLLTVISGYAQFSLGQMKSRDPYREALAEINRAADRAAIITRQLLALGRRQQLAPKIIDINEWVNNNIAVVGQVLGGAVEVESRLAEELCPVFADAAQLSQVLINLATNSRDAMPNGGRFTIETKPIVLAAPTRIGSDDAPAGSYAQINLIDTGAGMPPEALAQAFEPFFSSKTKLGAGLGLAVAQGIIRQSGGYIEAESEVGQGSVFRIYLPIAETAV